MGGGMGAWRAKVSDYGSANLQHLIIRSVNPGGPLYAAPEAANPREHSPSMDVFSYGVLLLEMITRRIPLPEERVGLIDGLSDVTIDKLKQLQTQITELKTKNAHQLLVHSDDLDWNTIAYEQFNSEHSAYDCYLRYKHFLQPSVNHKEWMPNEVWRLNELAKKYEGYNWEAIAAELNTGRTAVQCLRCYKTSSHLLSKKYVNFILT
uniref:Myb-like domain-containing protein n=1 Tax=Amphimedon queenslandica TaxID=400682 RepID=A0A1X7SHM7_AMPQE